MQEFIENTEQRKRHVLTVLVWNCPIWSTEHQMSKNKDISWNTCQAMAICPSDIVLHVFPFVGQDYLLTVVVYRTWRHFKVDKLQDTSSSTVFVIFGIFNIDNAIVMLLLHSKTSKDRNFRHITSLPFKTLIKLTCKMTDGKGKIQEDWSINCIS